MLVKSVVMDGEAEGAENALAMDADSAVCVMSVHAPEPFANRTLERLEAECMRLDVMHVL